MASWNYRTKRARIAVIRDGHLVLAYGEESTFDDLATYAIVRVARNRDGRMLCFNPLEVVSRGGASKIHPRLTDDGLEVFFRSATNLSSVVHKPKPCPYQAYRHSAWALNASDTMHGLGHIHLPDALDLLPFVTSASQLTPWLRGLIFHPDGTLEAGDSLTVALARNAHDLPVLGGGPVAVDTSMFRHYINDAGGFGWSHGGLVIYHAWGKVLAARNPKLVPDLHKGVKGARFEKAVPVKQVFGNLEYLLWNDYRGYKPVQLAAGFGEAKVVWLSRNGNVVLEDLRGRVTPPPGMDVMVLGYDSIRRALSFVGPDAVLRYTPGQAAFKLEHGNRSVLSKFIWPIEPGLAYQEYLSPSSVKRT